MIVQPWYDEATQAFYYAAGGAVLLGTGIRYVYRFIREKEEQNKFVRKMRQDWPNFKHALKLLGNKLEVDLDFLDDDNPSYKPSHEEDQWT